MFKKYWFRNKQYGYGWYPASIEGWIVFTGYMLFIFLISLLFVGLYKDDVSFVIFYMGSIFLATVILLLICVKTGEKPKWSWGNKK